MLNAGGGGGTTIFGIVLAQVLGVFVMLKEGGRGGGVVKRFPPLLSAGGEGGLQNVSDPRCSHIVAAPLPSY